MEYGEGGGGGGDDRMVHHVEVDLVMRTILNMLNKVIKHYSFSLVWVLIIHESPALTLCSTNAVPYSLGTTSTR